jgi:glucose/arabinose dehydrogenase
MTFYEGDLFPDWRGKLLVSTLSGQLLLLDLGEEAVIAQQAVIEGSIGRIRDVRSGPDGFVYLVNDASDGGLYRMGPAFDQAVYVQERATETDAIVPVTDPSY